MVIDKLKAMDNWKSVIFLLASGQGLLLSLALLAKGRRGQLSNVFLGLILWVISLELLNAWGMQVKYHSSPTAFPFWVLQSYLILPPSVWLFAQLSIKPDFKFRRTYWLLYLPSGIEVIVRIARSLYHHITGVYLPSLIENSAWFFFAEILPIGGMCIVLWDYGRKLILVHKSLKGYSGRAEPIRFFRLYGLFGFLLLLTILWVFGVVINFPIFGFIELILTLFLFTLGYIGYHDATFFEVPQLFNYQSTEKPTFSQYDDAKQLQRLTKAFQQDMLHTQSKLTLEDLASTINLPPRYVSYLINTYHGTNVNHFINTFRVEEVIRKLNDPAEQHKTLLALALEAGFNSKSTFNQFLKTTQDNHPLNICSSRNNECSLRVGKVYVSQWL
ncbi:helix-turn-helix domain-containing protein [Spirosoma sp. HMF3257]|uniref:HTH araC/xylS-type domain-containing protein n=1 Tax=Spirosoma telluris TaxID=2183553 RepID=A0A327NS18_9BACT|nr:helix-turn-helix domain-containing protein [Spirosoma telluris]RAI77443.1 hypothetical protein HMF3257_30615 [Spirosoma telluris]